MKKLVRRYAQLARFVAPLPLDLAWESQPNTEALAEEVKNARKKPPKGYPTSSAQYADPKHHKYPIDAKHIRAALSYFGHAENKEKGGYSDDEWAAMGRRIAAAANRLVGKGHHFSGGKIVVKKPKSKGAMEAADAPSKAKAKASKKKVYDPDHDGDNDASAKGDTDHDYVKKDGSPGPKAKGAAKGKSKPAPTKAGKQAKRIATKTGKAAKTMKKAANAKPAKPAKSSKSSPSSAAKSSKPAAKNPSKSTADGNEGGKGHAPVVAVAVAVGHGHGGAPGATPQEEAQEEAALMRYVKGLKQLDLVDAGEAITIEETVINGEPCFSWQAMVIPADAISRNTVPGKRGPTYYSARRMQQYYSENQQLLEELRAQGEHVTVYPRHAAAALDASQPLGWVDGYELRPSSRIQGAQDLWYRGMAPLNNSEARAALANMRTGLTKYSSLRTYPSPQLVTQPVKVNGQVVEEAVKLPIAGIDLVATRPGLPVQAIQLLEEAAQIEAAEAITPPTPITRRTRPAASSRRAIAKEERSPTMKIVCPCGCGADVTELVARAAEEAYGADKKHLQHELGDQKRHRKAAEAEVEALRKQMKRGAKALEEVSTLGTTVSEQQAQIAALQAEVQQYATLRDQMAAMQAQEAVEQKIDELVAKDKTMGKHMRAVVLEEAAKQGITDPAKLPELYWELRAQNTDRVYSMFGARYQQPAGFGFSHVASEEYDDDESDAGYDDAGDTVGASEEQQPPAAAPRMPTRRVATPSAARRPAYNAAQREVLAAMRRVVG